MTAQRSSDAKQPAPGVRDAATIRAAHVARVAAELAAADRLSPGSDAVASTGAPFAEVMLVKGLRGPAEESGGAALSGADGAAVDLALEALGYSPARAFRTLSRPEPGEDAGSRAERLRLQLEAVDPEVIIALDAAAAEDLAEAIGIPPLQVGTPRQALGRTLLAVSGFEASLASEKSKAKVWTELRTVKRGSTE